MKILHIVPTYMPATRYGGPIQSVHDLNKSLVAHGAEVTVYTTSIDGPHDLAVPTGVPVMRDGVTVYYFKSTSLRRWFYSRDMRRALKETMREFDLVHITSVFLAASTLGAYYARKYRIPYIISPRGSLMREPLRKKSSFKKRLYLSLIEKRNLCGASAIHFTSSLERDEYIAEGLPLRRGVVIPNGIDLKQLIRETAPGLFRARFNIPADRPIILFLGRINWKKGLDTLIEAFALVRKEEPRALLVIAGGDDEGYARKVEEMARVQGVFEDVRFVGALSGEEKVAAYKEASVFVLLSYAENFALTVAEALALGVPSVISDRIGIAPAIARAHAALVIEKNAEQAAWAILHLIRSPETARALSLEARAYASDAFSLDRIAEECIRIYADIAKRSSS